MKTQILLVLRSEGLGESLGILLKKYGIVSYGHPPDIYLAKENQDTTFRMVRGWGEVNVLRYIQSKFVINPGARSLSDDVMRASTARRSTFLGERLSDAGRGMGQILALRYCAYYRSYK